MKIICTIGKAIFGIIAGMVVFQGLLSFNDQLNYLTSKRGRKEMKEVIEEDNTLIDTVMKACANWHRYDIDILES